MKKQRKKIKIRKSSPLDFLSSLTAVLLQEEEDDEAAIDKMVEEAIIRAKYRELAPIIDGWITGFTDVCRKHPEYRNTLCGYFKKLMSKYIRIFYKKIKEEYGEYLKKKGENRLEEMKKLLDEQMKRLKEAYQECCGEELKNWPG